MSTKRPTIGKSTYILTNRFLWLSKDKRPRIKLRNPELISARQTDQQLRGFLSAGLFIDNTWPYSRYTWFCMDSTKQKCWERPWERICTIIWDNYNYGRCELRHYVTCLLNVVVNYKLCFHLWQVTINSMQVFETYVRTRAHIPQYIMMEWVCCSRDICMYVCT